MATTYCSECDALINTRDTRMGASLRYPKCDAELEVISTYPLEIIFRSDYDHGDDDNDDDDDNDG